MRIANTALTAPRRASRSSEISNTNATKLLLDYYYYLGPHALTFHIYNPITLLVLYLRPGEHLVERVLAVAVAVELAEDRADALLGGLPAWLGLGVGV